MKLRVFGAILLALFALAEGQLELKYERRGSIFARETSPPKYQHHEYSPKFTPDPQYRLNYVVEPEHYKVEIRPVFDAGTKWEQYTAPGRVNIYVTAKNATDTIMMHHHMTMNISDVTVVREGVAGNLTDSTTYQEENNFLYIKLNQNLAIGAKYNISMNFVSKIWTDKSNGLYLARYQELDNVTYVEKQMVSTQFESVAAREAFPCFDESRFKASFEWVIYHKREHRAWCNSVHTTPTNDTEAGWLRSEFANTSPVRMPTYLVAIIVADYRCQPASSKNTTQGFFGKDVNICGRPQAIEERKGGVNPADYSSKIIQWLQTHYDYTYELPKIDSVALPEAYFGGGAMENWGLNTYREPYLLYYEGDSTEANRLTILSILTHELAHQWFGNLVTCNWWSQIWLNEGFATYVSFEGVAALFPEHGNYLEEMLWETVQYALAYDVGRDDPVINHAQTIEEQDSVFGTATYDKGGSLLRMMAGFMSKVNFTNGVRSYLKANAYKAAEQDQLFAALEPYVNNLPEGSTLKTVMDTWTLKPGYPLVRVSRLGGNLLISQEVYAAADAETAYFDEYPNELWEVPIVIVTGSPASPTAETATWLKKNEILKPFLADTNATYVHVNPEGRGFYRVHYEKNLFDALITHLVTDPETINHLSRSQLIDDYFSLAAYRHVTMYEAMETTKYLKSPFVETSHIVWNTIFTNLNRALTPLRFSGSLGGLQAYLGPIILKTLNDPNVTMTQAPMEGAKAIFRAKLLDWACAMGRSECFTLANNLVRNYIDNNTAVPTDLAQVLYCPAIQNNGSLFEDLLEKMRTVVLEPVPHLEATRLLNGIACVTDPAKLNFLLEESLENDNPFRLHRSAVALYQRIATRSVASRDVVLNYLDTNLDKFIARTSVDDAIRVINSITSVMATTPDRVRVETFLDLHKDVLSNATIGVSLGSVDNNVKWLADNYPALEQWLSLNNNP